MEIVKDRAVASAQPVVKVTHAEAKVTHGAAIGSVDHHQLETLMAHGLSPEQAVDLIVGGLLGKRPAGGAAIVPLTPKHEGRDKLLPSLAVKADVRGLTPP